MIFIVGNSRSGTTLMARILNRHPNVYILNETHFMEEFSYEKTHFDSLREKGIKRIINQFLTIQRKGYYRKKEFDTYPQAEIILKKINSKNQPGFTNLISLLFTHEASQHRKIIPGDQTPRHIFYINELFAMFPHAKFINMIRDPRAVLLSQKLKWKAGLRKKLPIFETIRTYFNFHPILMSYMWKKGIQKALSVDEMVKNNSWIDVKFEELIDNPEKTIKRVCEFLGIDFTATMLDVTVSMSSTNTDEGKRGFSRNITKAWIERLSSTDIYLAEKTNKRLIHRMGYDLTDRRPSILHLGLYFLVLPFQLLIVFLLNYNRMGNPFIFIKKRLQ